ncbi:MAG: tetratricopeptide repeat protein [Actinomycetota bacterium]
MLDVTDATFQTEVVERSAQVPVVVDLWAEWCGPCKTLGPILEKVIAATDGKVVGVKVDVDANPGVAGAFQVQSIPAVYALVDGKPVDGFLGAQPEHMVQEFVDRLAPTEDDDRLAALVDAGDEASLRAVLDEVPDHEDAVVALAGLLVDAERNDEALEVLGRIPENPATRQLAAIARSGGEVGDVEGKLAGLLERVKADEDARQEFVDLLDMLGPDDPRTGEWRRKLSSALY